MMRRLRQFVRRKMHNTDSEQKNGVPPLPSLALTTLHDPDTWQPTCQTSGFFALPHDIRYEILRMAFGDRTIHIDLRLRPHLHNFESSGGRNPLHAGYPPLFELEPFSPHTYSGQGKDLTWKWFHCVCHHLPPGTHHPELVCRDECLTGRALCHRSSWAWDTCQLGAMGMMLSCKQR